MQIIIAAIIIAVLSVVAVLFRSYALIAIWFLLPIVVAIGVPLYTVVHYRWWKYDFRVWQYKRYIDGHKDISADESW